MNVLRHWIVFKADGPVPCHDGDVAERWRAGGFPVQGPFVLEAQQPPGAVEAERERIVALIRREASETFDGKLEHELRALADRIAVGGQ
jgi:hypothetical protein